MGSHVGRMQLQRQAQLQAYQQKLHTTDLRGQFAAARGQIERCIQKYKSEEESAVQRYRQPPQGASPYRGACLQGEAKYLQVLRGCLANLQRLRTELLQLQSRTDLQQITQRQQALLVAINQDYATLAQDPQEMQQALAHFSFNQAECLDFHAQLQASSTMSGAYAATKIPCPAQSLA